MPPEPLLVPALSQRNIGTHQPPGAETKALRGLPEPSHRSAAGSNSYDGARYGECRHCPSEWMLTTEDRIPPHADRRIRENGSLRRICQGSNESPVTRLEADAGA